jgi:hypothetical protein
VESSWNWRRPAIAVATHHSVTTVCDRYHTSTCTLPSTTSSTVSKAQQAARVFLQQPNKNNAGPACCWHTAARAYVAQAPVNYVRQHVTAQHDTAQAENITASLHRTSSHRTSTVSTL